MKPLMVLILAALLIAFLAVGANAQDAESAHDNGGGVCRFIDEDGDGFNDLAPDADGDGIPNGLDPDYEKPEDGSGLMNQWAHKYGELFRRYFGQDVLSAYYTYQYGPGDGTGTGVGPGDGTGFGPGMSTGNIPGEGDGSGSGQENQDHRGGRRK